MGKDVRNFIKFYYTNDKLIAEIHKQGKYRIVSKPEDIKELIRLAKAYGHIIDPPATLTENFFTITRKYQEYLKNKKKPLTIIGEILPNMKLSRKTKTIGMTIVAGTLAAVIATGSIAKVGNGIETADARDDAVPTNISEYDVEENPITEIENTESVDLGSMLRESTFHFSYEDRTHSENMQNSKRYQDLFEKYAADYGLDANLLMALVAQESGGEHYDNLNNGPAEGIMQIEKIAHIGSTVSAYNFTTKETDTIEINELNIKNLETNIQIGCMILRDCLENNHYNIPLALQTYNFGPGNMNEVLSTCSATENLDYVKLRKDPNNTSWLDYREFLNTGDPKYIEHVFSYLDSGTTITIRDNNNQIIGLKLINDYQKTLSA